MLHSCHLFLIVPRRASTDWQVSIWNKDLAITNDELTHGYIDSNDAMSVSYTWKSSGNVCFRRFNLTVE